MTVTGRVGVAVAWLVSVSAATAIAGSKEAKPPRIEGSAAVVRAVSDCRKVEEPGARLACYDAAAGALEAAQTKGELVAVDREQVRTIRRQAFGLSLPAISLLPHFAGDEGADRLTVSVERVGRTPQGGWIMGTTEDATWVQTDSTDLVNDPHKGSKLVVSHGALGSFFCKVDGQTAVRCKRVV